MNISCTLKVYRAGFLLARSTLQSGMCFFKLPPLPPLWYWSVLMTGTVPRAPFLEGMMINKVHKKVCEVLFYLKDLACSFNLIKNSAQ